MLPVGPAAAPGSRFRPSAGNRHLFPAPEVRGKRRFPRTWQRDRLRTPRRTRRSPPRPAPFLRHLVLRGLPPTVSSRRWGSLPAAPGPWAVPSRLSWRRESRAQLALRSRDPPARG